MDPQPLKPQNKSLGLAPSTNELFFSVMPKEKSVPKINTESIAQATIIQTKPKTKINFKLIFIILFVLAILGGTAFAIFYKLNKSKDTVSTDQTQQTEAPIIQPEGVTTTNIWQEQYFGAQLCESVANCGDSADPDEDGLTNLQEFSENTDPLNSDTDSDGLADGDEINIFGGSPKELRTAGNATYTDADDAKGGFDTPLGGIKLSTERLELLKQKMSQFGLHSPTTETLGEAVNIKYNYTGQSSEISLANLNLDSSSNAKLDRDIQRSSTIKKLGNALIKYKAAKQKFPTVANFADMANLVKPYNNVATNPVDPINQGQFVYSYSVSQNAQDFSMTYFSETQNKPIRFSLSDAVAHASEENASANDTQRLEDLETIRTALLIYSSSKAAEGQNYTLPTKQTYKVQLVPEFIDSIPKDPKSGQDYSYTVSENLDSFVLKGNLENPSAGQNGIICTEEEECHIY